MHLRFLSNSATLVACLLLFISGQNSPKSQEAPDKVKLEDPSEYHFKKRNLELQNDNSTKSAYRGISKQQDATISSTFIPQRKQDKHLFKIGLIVPRTAFLSQYKSYKQRIKDTFTHMLQLSRHQHQKSASNPYVSSNQVGSVPSSSSSLSDHQQFDKKHPISSCDSSSNPLMQQHWSLPWSELTFNRYFDINVANLVNLSQRSNAQEIIESMCQKLIKQNVSVIIYLENNQDQTVASLESHSEILMPRRSQQNDHETQTQATSQSGMKESRQNSTNNSALISPNSASDQSGLLLRSHNQQANSQAHFIMHLAHSAGVPTIAWSVTATLAQRPKKQRTLHLAPTVAHEAEAMLAIMQRYSWYSFSVLSTTLAGHDDFILALRQFMTTYNSKPSSTSSGASSSTPTPKAFTSTSTNSSATSADSISGINTLNVNLNGGAASARGPGQESDFVSNAQLGKTFKLLDVITIKKQTMSHIEKEMRKLTVSESRVVLLYATRGEAIDILRVAKILKLTKRSYAWIVAQSVIGPNENERAPIEFHPGLLGIYFRSNHERLLDELSRAITIIAHGLERFVRDKNGLDGDKENQSSRYIDDHGGLGMRGEGKDSRVGEEKFEIKEEKKNEDRGMFVSDRMGKGISSSSGPNSSSSGSDSNSNSTGASSGKHVIKSGASYYNVTISNNQMNKIHHHSTTTITKSITNSKSQLHRETRDYNLSADSMTEYRKRLLSAYSTCSGPSDSLSDKKADLLYEYFSKSSPSNVFDADGSLKDVELSVVNLDNERQWRRIGCFSQASLTIDDITWPEKAERPPSGTMEKFHLRAVFLEEPSFVNLADPDTETGECKTNRAIRCRYKVIRTSFRDNKNNYTILQQTNETTIAPQQDRFSETNGSLLAHEDDQVIQIFPSKDTTENSNEFEYKCCSGFCIDLMEKFATDLKFSYDLYRVPDGLWGILENNSWNGLIGEIVRGKADVIVSSIKINSDRQKAVDFTVPFLDTGISILVAKQTGVIAKLAFLEPFDTLAWIMFICVGIPIAAISIFYFEWLSPNGFYAKNNQKFYLGYGKVQQTHNGRDHQKFSFCRTLWLVITILFGSAAHIDSPKGYTARFMSNVWATFAVVFLAVYTANLAAFMITREEYLEFSGISDSRLAYPFYRHPPLKFGTITGGNTHAVLSANKPNLYNYMRSFNRPSVEDGIFYSTYYPGVDAVKTGKLDAFVYDALVLDYMASQDPECKLVNVGSWYSMTGYALAFPKESRYYEKFNMKMLEYRKNGELDRLRRFWLQGLCKPGLNRHSISKPLDLSQFMSAFLLLGAGILLSVFVLALEHLYILYVRDRLIRSKNRMKLIKLLYPFSLSLAQTLSLPGDGEEDIICSKTKKALEKSDLQGMQSTYLEMKRLNFIHETREFDFGHSNYRDRFNYQEKCLNIHSVINKRIKRVSSGNLVSQTNQAQVAPIIKRPLNNPELLLLQSLEHYENQMRAVQERGLVLFGQTKNLYPDCEVNRSEFRQVKWLVGELRNKLKDLLLENKEEMDNEQGLELTSCAPLSNVPKIYVTRHPENQNSIVETSDHIVTKNEQCLRQTLNMRERVAECSTSSDPNCDIEHEPSSSSFCDNVVENKNNFKSMNEVWFSKSRRLSR